MLIYLNIVKIENINGRLMKLSKICLLIFILVISVFLSNSSFAVEFPNKPAKENFYVDEANLINEDGRTKINQIALALLKEEKIPLFVVTIPSLATYKASSMNIEQYAQALFDEWGIGYQDRNYGILLLVSRGDRKARIEFGKAWNHEHDDEANDIMQSLIIPKFKSGDYSSGIYEGVKGLDATARGLALPKPEIPKSTIILMIIGVIGIVAIAYSLFKSGRTGWGWAFLAAVAIIIFFILRAAATSGSSGGFGGGSSGGGGATGSW